MRQLSNFIAGEFRPPSGNAYLDVVEPATGKAHVQVPASTPADIDAAVAAAARAFPAWSAMPATQRSQILFNLADQIDKRLDDLAKAESTDTGKPISLAKRVDIPRAATNFRFFAGAVLHTSGDFHETGQPAVGAPLHAINYTLRRPRGVAGLISPWNLPLYLLSWKIAPAIATGNTCVCKPSEVTPSSAAILGELCQAAGVPAGVVNIVHGEGKVAGGSLVTHERVPTISFTGSTAVGRWIGEQTGRSLKRVSLELGGKNPFIVFADADYAAALDTCLRASFTNQGQICLCASRILVHRSLFDRFVKDLASRASEMHAGDPSHEATTFGSITSRVQLDKITRIVGEARRLGATVHCGGESPAPASLPPRCRDGFFFRPTVMTGLDASCSVEQEEIFGPVVSATPFDDDAQAISLANATPYGLAATVFTTNLSRAHHVAEKLESGIVWINCWMVRDLRTPFGGTKASGVGREGGLDAIRFFTEPKNVCIKLDET
ncbi:MAG: aldehyde dehydrogenase [Phycisphaerales bacterium]|jgi:aminomuconate-semialdehyde/2-hydroxymuconate-6-semialdehyde dehydrogenase